MRTVIDYAPYYRRRAQDEPPYEPLCVWPCEWVALPGLGDAPFVVAYRRRFALDRSASFRVHLSADERYELFLDGQRVCRGSERGDPDNWFFETCDFELDRGEHVFVARVWSLGTLAPIAQMSRRHGFIFSPEGDDAIELLGTGRALWEGKELAGYSYIKRVAAFWTGANVDVDGASFPWGFEKGPEGAGFRIWANS